MGEFDFTEIFVNLPNRTLLRVDEVSVFFAVSKMTIYRWYKADDLQGILLKGGLWIYRQSVEDLVRQNHGRKMEIEDDESPKKPKKTISPWMRR